MIKMRKLAQSGVAVMAASAVLLAGCGTTGNEAGNAGSNTSGSGLKPYEIVVAFYGNEQKDMQKVQDEMSKMTKEKMNATVKLMPIAISAWQQQTNLMLAGSEKIDLMFTSSGFGYSSQVAKGQLLPLNDLLEKHGAGITDALEPFQLAAARLNGENYGVPAIKDMASDYGILMRKDLVDKYEIDTSAIKSVEDMTPIFETISANEPDVVPLVAKNPGTAPFYAGYTTYDALGDGIGVLPNYDNGLKVVNWFESEEYAEELTLLRSWYEAGYLLKDASTAKHDGRELVKAGKAFAFFSNMKPGSDVEATRKLGREMVSVSLTPAYATTSTITSIMWSIPKNSKDPDRAMMLLNMLYSDKELYNLFTWGIEGEHYVKVSDNVMTYPEGVDVTNSGYNFNTPYMFGNQFLSYTWTTEEPDAWETMDAFNKGAVQSKALGFIFNVEDVKTEVAAVNNVIAEYRLGLDTGTLDPEEHLPAFNVKLKAAGIDKIINEKQKQIDEWAKAKG
ncbi:ABC transporter substrate-binding protein [Paenibacillus sp. J5C_2022]|uniref:ABC transporter substrate-binding protein n=1 Tax=Paenibacillus sp. J5C2022 TaxID=2977129 RepID=UPI0021CF79A6|nr:ABC transporter substrate-binding protein [Paenibacillus sp. J5C2022]MCU6707756.1 ABC transporter substrate-binding protein [Paenibacillus sp. J5C2022]